MVFVSDAFEKAMDDSEWELRASRTFRSFTRFESEVLHSTMMTLYQVPRCHFAGTFPFSNPAMAPQNDFNRRKTAGVNAG
jgi:hypothetical protein